MIIVGSVAAKAWYPEFRDPDDFDVWASPEEDVDLLVKEYMPYASQYLPLHREIFYHPKIQEYFGGVNYCATPEELYTIKYSHIFWEIPSAPGWKKHLADLIFFQQQGCRIHEGLFDILYPIWEGKHGSKKTDLTKESNQFFDDAVHRKYDHDSVHYSVAYTPGEPLYETVMKDGASVQMDMKKVWALPKDLQVKLFREEVYATALERIMIPKNYRGSPGAAYQWALRRTITSLTKGKSARFIVDNIQEFLHPDMDYVSHHRKNSNYLITLEGK